MTITYSKPTVINNIISITNNSIDTLTAGSKLDPSNYYITENHIVWIDKTLTIADYQVRKILLHLLKREITDYDKSTLVYNIIISHPLQQKIIPQLIEEALTNYVSQIWIADKALIATQNTANIFTELKSVSLMTENRTQRPYRII